MEFLSIVVRAVWDSEAGVWVATSEDVPGLVTEAETTDELVRKLHIMIPELLEDDPVVTGGEAREIPLYVIAECFSKVRLSNA